MEDLNKAIEKVKILREYSNCSISDAINAMKYKNTHSKCTACGYLRAIIGNTNQFSNK